MTSPAVMKQAMLLLVLLVPATAQSAAGSQDACVNGQCQDPIMDSSEFFQTKLKTATVSAHKFQNKASLISTAALDKHKALFAEVQKLFSAVQNNLDAEGDPSGWEHVDVGGGDRNAETINIENMVKNILRPNLMTFHDATAETLNSLHDAIVTVVDDNLVKTSVIEYDIAATIARQGGVHAHCRQAEATLIAAKDASCLAFTTFWQGITEPATYPTERPEVDVSTDGDAMVDYVTRMDEYFCGKGHTIREYEAACVNATAAADAKKPKCDSDQTTYEASFCDYRRELHDICKQLDSDYQRTVEAYQAEEAAAMELVPRWKVEFQALAKIECYINLWLYNDNHTNIKVDHNSECEQGRGQYFTQSDKVLDINYPEVPAKPACDLAPVENFPGTDMFQETYQADWDVKMVNACPAFADTNFLTGPPTMRPADATTPDPFFEAEDTR